MFKRISVVKAADLIENYGAIVVDIRDPVTYSQGHIETASRIDNSNIQAFLENTDKATPIVVCCYHGNSSQPAASMFAQQGFKECYSMDGGMCEWVLTKEVVSGE